ncbi:MAG: AraC family transcriptional regulator [Flavobacterium sp.]|jgi:AraC family transcriptional regulator
MEPRIGKLTEKKLVGMHLTMCLFDNKTFKLWSTFMPRRKEIINNCTNELISLQLYDPSYFSDFKPTTEFEKWATTEVTDFNSVP